MHDYSRRIKIDEVEEEDMGEMIEEGVMDDDHAAYYDDEEEVEEHVVRIFNYFLKALLERSNGEKF